MEQTPNYHLNKPARSEKVNVDLLNQNMDTVDSNLKNISDNLNVVTNTVTGLNDKLSGEIERSVKKDSEQTNALNNEAQRALASETDLSNKLLSEINRAKSAEAVLDNTINVNKSNWNDKYTKSEIDNKFSVLETSIDWKEAVDSYADIADKYPNPQDGWTVNVKDTDYTYRYSGAKWVPISANSIPKATNSVDGLLSKEDYADFKDADSKKHTHSNKSVIDGITSDLIAEWNKAEINVQSDWNETNSTSDAYIKNKPDFDAKVNKSGDTMSGALNVPNLTDTGLTGSRVVTSNANKQLVSSAITDTELGYLKGITGNIQEQLNKKINTGGNTATADKVNHTLKFTGKSTGTYDGSADLTIDIPNYDTEISNLKNSVSNGKKAVADAITKKGVLTSATADFSTMAANIGEINSGGNSGTEINLCDALVALYKKTWSNLYDSREQIKTSTSTTSYNSVEYTFSKDYELVMVYSMCSTGSTSTYESSSNLSYGVSNFKSAERICSFSYSCGRIAFLILFFKNVKANDTFCVTLTKGTRVYSYRIYSIDV